MIRWSAGLAAVAGLSATPALAAGEVFFSLRNTDFVVWIAFLVFIGILIYFKVPGMVTGLLDTRAEAIRSELNEARALREEAQALLATFERKQKDVQAQADRIVAKARDEAAQAAVQAKDDIRISVERRMKAAHEQLDSAQAAAIRDVRDRAVVASVAAARSVIAAQMTAAGANELIDDAITQVEAKLH